MSYSFMSVNVGKAENDRGRERKREEISSLPLSLVLSLESLYRHCNRKVIEVEVEVRCPFFSHS